MHARANFDRFAAPVSPTSSGVATAFESSPNGPRGFDAPMRGSTAARGDDEPRPIKLFLTNLASRITEAKLLELVQPNIPLEISFSTDVTPYYAAMLFDSEREAADAYQKVNGLLYGGLKIKASLPSKVFSRNIPESRVPQIAPGVANKIMDPSCNLYVKNLDAGVDEKVLYYLFTHYGEIVSIRIVRDETGQHKGYGFVLFNTPTAAQSALEEMHHRKVGPRKIHVSISTHKKSDEPFLAPSASSRAESALNWRPRPDNPSAGLGPWAQVSAVSSLIRPGKEDDPFSAQFEGMKLTDRDHRDREQSDGSDAEIENGTVLAKVGFPQFGKVMVEKIVRQPQMQLPSLGAAGGKTGYAKAIIAGVKPVKSPTKQQLTSRPPLAAKNI